MRVSILLPTRKRFDSLMASIESLVDTTEEADLEFMFGVDDDDEETLRRLRTTPLPPHKLWVTPRLSYLNLHVYVNELSARSTGDWLFLWNDDALMQTQGWDRIVAEYQGQLVVVNPQSNHGNHERANCIFPIVNRKIFELLGHFSCSNHNDTYIEHIANRLDIRRDVPIYICHDRADLTGANNDDVYAEREFTTNEFFGSENQARILEDIETLWRYLHPAVEAV